jgi:hypothetical protein
MNYIVFSIDNVSDIRTLSKFLRHVDTQAAMQKMTGRMLPLIGSWQGVMEQSFIMLAVDYDKHVRHSGYTDNQECIMHVPSDARQPATLEYPCGKRESIGKMQNVSKDVAMQHDGWTYNIELDKYFVAAA